MAPARFVVEAGHITQFARAIGETSAEFLSGSLAPPTFTVASAQADSEHPFRPQPGKKWFGSGREPIGAPPAEGGDGTSLYAGHRFEYHRPVRPGVVLVPHSREGATWEKDGGRGGRLRFREIVTEMVDEGTGELVITSTIVSVSMERQVS